VRKVAVLYTNDRPANVAAKLTKELAGEGGFQLVKEVELDLRIGDPVAAVAQIRDHPQPPDAVFVIASNPSDATRLIKAFREAGYSPPGILAFGPGFLQSTVLDAGPDGDGLMASTAWSREVAGRNLAAKSVMELYEERYSQPMGETAAGAFTAVLVLAEAIDNARSVDPQRVRAALLNLDIPGREMIMPWSGLRFDGSHQNLAANGVVEQRVDDVFRVVFPGELQQADPVWPRQAAGA
jgi:branched-chain amino acid transport system substrate-binding protein